MVDILDMLKQNSDLWDLYTQKEEYNNLRLDQYGRFPFSSSKNQKITDPQVWRFLVNNGLHYNYPNGKQFAICLTHDVDDIYPPLIHTLASTVNCIKKLDIKEISNQWIKQLRKKRNSPYKNFTQIMEIEDKYNAKINILFLWQQIKILKDYMIL
jgi:hypothetical protein